MYKQSLLLSRLTWLRWPASRLDWLTLFSRPASRLGRLAWLQCHVDSPPHVKALRKFLSTFPFYLEEYADSSAFFHIAID